MNESSRQNWLGFGMEAIRFLSDEIGPRPPGSREESQAATYVASQLERLGLSPRIDRFRSARSFGPAYLGPFLLALSGSSAQRRRSGRYFRAGRLSGHLLTGVAVGLAYRETRFALPGATAWLGRRESRNVIGSIDAQGSENRTVCLVCHLDSSRSGWMFHPRVTPHLKNLVAGTGIAMAVQTVAGPLGRLRGLRWTERASRALLWLATGLILQREVMGEDIPGANDNASGVGACLAVAAALVDRPLERTRVIVLFTGSEESGVLGMRDFLTRNDTTGWRFLNFDGVGADAPLRVLSREGGPLGGLAADPELLEMAASIGREEPALAAAPLEHGSGLPYDSTAVLARGGRAISIVNQGEGAIPDYHWPSDHIDRVSREAFERAVKFGLALVRRIDEAG